MVEKSNVQSRMRVSNFDYSAEEKKIRRLTDDGDIEYSCRWLRGDKGEAIAVFKDLFCAWCRHLLVAAVFGVFYACLCIGCAYLCCLLCCVFTIISACLF